MNKELDLNCRERLCKVAKTGHFQSHARYNLSPFSATFSLTWLTDGFIIRLKLLDPESSSMEGRRKRVPSMRVFSRHIAPPGKILRPRAEARGARCPKQRLKKSALLS
jgi:hypothetical protein